MPDEPVAVRRKISLNRGDDWHKYAADAHGMIHRLHGLVRLNGTKSVTKPGVSIERGQRPRLHDCAFLIRRRPWRLMRSVRHAIVIGFLLHAGMCTDRQ